MFTFGVRAGILFVSSNGIPVLQLYAACLSAHVLVAMPALPSLALLKTAAVDAGETFALMAKLMVVGVVFFRMRPWANRLDKMLRTTMANKLAIPEVVDNGWMPEPEPRHELRSIRACAL